MLQNIIRCPHCGKETIQVVLGPCWIEDDDNVILAFHCTTCHWEHKLGEEPMRVDFPAMVPGLS